MFMQCMRWSMRFFASLALFFLPLHGQVTLDSMMDTTLQTWSLVDMVRAIARDDRHHLYPRLIKANLDLYANTYWFTAFHTKEAVPAEYSDTINQLFTTLLSAQKDTVSGQSISDNPHATLFPPSAVALAEEDWSPAVEVPLQQNNIGGLFSCMIMDQTRSLWNNFTNPKKT